MKKKPYLVESSQGLPVAPLVDVVLLLLIFFMLVTRYLAPSLSVTLPEAAASQVDDQPSITITIDEDGNLAVDGDMYQWAALPRLLENRDPDTQVRIAADKETDYDFIVRALDLSAAAGLSHIALETRPAGR